MYNIIYITLFMYNKQVFFSLSLKYIVFRNEQSSKSILPIKYLLLLSSTYHSRRVKSKERIGDSIFMLDRDLTRKPGGFR